MNYGIQKKQCPLFELNKRSLRNKHDGVGMLLDQLNQDFDILAFTETWFFKRLRRRSLRGI